MTARSLYRSPRRGAILLIVLVLLALFAVVGLSFALYAESEATAARLRTESAKTDDPPSAEKMAEQFLGRLLYAGGDTGDDVLSALRGHEMDRAVYGTQGNRDVPYNGVGRVWEDLTGMAYMSTAGAVNISDRNQVINYSLTPNSSSSVNGPANLPAALFDPDRLGVRAGTAATTPPTTTYVGKNRPWTYPDRGDVYVAVQDPTSGRVVLPSFHRPQLFRDTNRPVTESELAQTNPNWTNAAGRYKILRPRPADHAYDSGDGRTLTQDFPYPPANGDGTITGDVQNIVGTDGVQRNDAVWLYAGLPVTRWRGRNITALIAPTVLPLDGRINLNVAGNILGQKPGVMPTDPPENDGTNASHHGFGPWEQNPRKLGLTDADVKTLVEYRYSSTTVPPLPAITETPQPRQTAVVSLPFANVPGGTYAPQSYAFVNWDGAAGGVIPTTEMNNLGLLRTADFDTMTMMTDGKTFRSEPDYFGPPATYVPSPGTHRHPGLFNPYHWVPNRLGDNRGRLVEHSNTRRSLARFNGVANDYAAPFYGRNPPGELTGIGIGTASAQQRQLVTTISNSLHRPGIQPMFRDRAAGGLEYLTNSFVDNRPVADRVFSLPITAPTDPLMGDYSGVNQIQSRLTALGAIDVNRPLADFRADTTKPLSHHDNINGMTGTVLSQAQNDRQTLARDIFVRLVAAMGGRAIIDPSTGTFTLPQPDTAMPGSYTLATTPMATPVTTAQYDALRRLAQLAANIVDFVDNDDICTTFVWNPRTATSLFGRDTGSLSEPLNFSDPMDANALSNRVIFGTEKPRVVLNEVYAEAATPSTGTQHEMRFWFELINTGKKEPATSQSPLSGVNPADAMNSVPGSVRFQNVTSVTTPFSPYRIEVFSEALPSTTLMTPRVIEQLTNPTNILGTITPPPPMTDPNPFRLTVDSNDFVCPDVGSGTILEWLEPNDGAKPTVNPMAATPAERRGLVVAGPPVATSFASGDFPGTSTTRVAELRGATTYLIPDSSSKNPATLLNDLRNHTVVLRRLANPYVPFNATTNPYLPVDYMAHVQAADGMSKDFTNSPGNTRTDSGPPALGTRQSTVREKPYVGVEGATVPLPAAGLPNQPVGLRNRSLFQQNPATSPVLDQQDWIPHLDRPVVNALELMFVSRGRPVDLTHQTQAAGSDVRQQQLVNFTAPDPSPTDVAPAFYRAMEFLTTKPWGYGLPTGGRVPGRVNINMIRDVRVLQALLDSNPTVKRTTNSFDGSHIQSLWNQLFESPSPVTTIPTDGTGNPDWMDPTHPKAWDHQQRVRTPGISLTNTVGVSVDDVSQGQILDKTAFVYEGTGASRKWLLPDRPFKPFGVAAFNEQSVDGQKNESGLSDTILRWLPDMSGAEVRPGYGGHGQHLYHRTEMLRKLQNNITYTSDTYLVVMTVGFFEVRNPGPWGTTNPPILGKEIFDETPGDLRQKFSAIIDRSMLAQEVDQTTGTVKTNRQAGDVWMTTINETPYGTTTAPAVVNLRFAANGSKVDVDGNTVVVIFYEGREHIIKKGSKLVLGTGSQIETISVADVGGRNPNDSVVANTSPFDQATGMATVTLQTAPTRTHYAGESVANAVLGSPGKQADFRLTDPANRRYRGVVPYFERIPIN